MSAQMFFELHQKLLTIVAVLGAIACVFLQRFFARRQFARDNNCKPVARCLGKEYFFGLDALPIALRASRQHKLLEWGRECYATYGNTFRVKELNKSAILTVEPENIKTVLSVKFNDYGIGHRLEVFRPLLGEGIFNTDGDHWSTSRSLIRPSFTRTQIADLTNFENLIQDLFKLLPRDGKTVVDLQDLFFRYSIDSATEFLFGHSVNTLKKTQQGPDFAEAFYYAQRYIIVRATFGPFKALYRDAKADKSIRTCREFAQPFVDEAFRAAEAKIKSNEADFDKKKRIFSHELALRTSNKTRVLDELMNLLLAGRDTTASLLSNLFFMLARNPKIWNKLRRAVAHLEGRAPSYEELRSIKYVENCINECKYDPMLLF
jgi:cytochrome P450